MYADVHRTTVLVFFAYQKKKPRKRTIMIDPLEE